jgi:hypothetical protein
MEDNETQFLRAVQNLSNAGIDVEATDYGFSARLVDATGELSAECGIEHDWSISMSISADAPPTRWVFCTDVDSMASCLISAKAKIESGNSKSWLEALAKSKGEFNCVGNP